MFCHLLITLYPYHVVLTHNIVILLYFPYYYCFYISAILLYHISMQCLLYVHIYFILHTSYNCYIRKCTNCDVIVLHCVTFECHVSIICSHHIMSLLNAFHATAILYPHCIHNIICYTVSSYITVIIIVIIVTILHTVVTCYADTQ